MATKRKLPRMLSLRSSMMAIESGWVSVWKSVIGCSLPLS
jgi:hypothetical protein